uniref:HotDog ACOT-type domain-containing protein n=1 Tax=Moniliophthora roreri TaxID=221103 RepID=A0A0W0FHL1_MONRR
MLRFFQTCGTSSFRNLGCIRTLYLTARRSEASTQKSFSGVASPLIAEEAQDVSSLDRLLKAVRQRSNPDYHSMVPIRTPIMWSEVLLTSESKAPSEDTKIPKTSAETAPDLSPRNMHDSYTEFILPFGSSAQLLENYTNASGGIRTGKLMEHLDSLAGSISYKHMLGPGVQTLGKIQERGFYIVTASVDRLDMLGQLNPNRDLRLSGQVIYTGRSSMEVLVKMETLTGSSEKQEETIMLGRFSMVCRDANTHRARSVNPLKISTPEEQALYSMGEAMKAKRQTNAQRSLSRVPPSSSEAGALHTYYLKYGQQNGILDPDLVYMSDTRVENCMLMFPQERNVHQKIFGGYLMRLAYELGFSNASMFSKGHVRFLSLDGISFAKPVPIGSILRLTSYILHSTSSAEYPMLIHVGVTANVVDIKTGLEQTTNEFRFTWCKEEGEETRKVVPKTYQEAMLWLEGRRALEIGEAFRGLRTSRT